MLLAHPRRPTAVFVSFDSTAESLYMIATKMGLRIPEDLSIVCFGGAHRDNAISRRLTAITVDETVAARQAVQLLAEMRAGTRSLKNGEVIPMQLGVSDGQTLATLPITGSDKPA